MRNQLQRLLLDGRPISWLLRDEFDDTRAAGAVNGTLATPGPGTRVVVDAASNEISIGAGQMQHAGAATTTGMWLNGLARTGGRITLWKFTLPGAVQNVLWGWGINQTSIMTSGNSIQFTASTLYMRDGTSNVAVGAYTATTYNVSVVLRSGGAFYFIKGGAFATWTLLWATVANIVATLYPGNWNQTAIANSSDFVRVPVALWLPTPLAYDSFTRGNGALGSSETTGPDSQGTPARTWVDTVGTTQVTGNKAQASALVGGIAIATVDTGVVDVLVSATLTRVGGNIGVVLRYQDADNYVYAYHDGTNCVLVKRVATVETTVITAAVAIGAGALVVICSGTSFSMYLNNVQVGTTQTILTLTTGTLQGLYSSNVGNTQDAFLVFSRGTDGAYSALDKWST